MKKEKRQKKNLVRSPSSINCTTKPKKKKLKEQRIYVWQITHRILEISLAFVTIPFENTSVLFHSPVLHYRLFRYALASRGNKCAKNGK